MSRVPCPPPSLPAAPSRRRPAALAAAALLAGLLGTAHASSSGVVISQVYGGNGATLSADYVELFNAGTSAVSLTGWSVQYASATGTGTFAGNGVVPVSGTLQPGQHFLVQLATATTGGPLPPADATGSLNLSSTGGKVILARTATGLACNGGTTPCDAAQSAQIVDLVGYGSATFFEGAAAPAPSASTALVRAGAGCTDTDVNASDFGVAAPAPRNTASALAACGGGGGGGGGGGTPLTIPRIQGAGTTSPWVGQAVVTSGVVTRVNGNGYFLQDLAGDGDPATSDGVFVYTGAAPTVAAGQLVQVAATVAEFNTGAASNADTAAHTVTELTAVTATTVIGSGYAVAPVVLAMPLADIDELERVEGMLVRLDGPLTVQQNYFLGRYGQLSLAAGGRVETPTNRALPGAPAATVAADNRRRLFVLDDGSSAQNPNPMPYLAADGTVRAGDTTPSVTGVVDYGLATSSNADAGSWRVHPTATPTFSRANPRTPAPDPVGGNLRVASLNVLNYFTTIDDGRHGCAPSGTAADCRGADSAAEFSRQRTKLVEALVAMDADIVGLMEMQNDGGASVQDLVDAVNARLGATVYAAVPAPSTGSGTDAIQVAMIHQPARAARVGDPMSDTAPVNHRAPLAQAFQAVNGERVTVIVNHLKSKGCDGATGADLDQGDGQGCWNALRVQQADQLRRFVATVQARTGVADTLLVGDFNAYAKEDPITSLTANGFVDQVGRFQSFGYSYVFNGAAGRLDQALATASLSPKVTGATEWHINADEPAALDYNLEYRQPACASCAPDGWTPTPYRASDHDPVVVGLSLVHPVTGTDGRDRLKGTAGDDRITGGPKADRLIGGAGRDVFVYATMQDGMDGIVDFVPGTDRIDLSALLASIGADPATAWSLGVVSVEPSGPDTVLVVDPDGPGGRKPGRALATLQDVAPEAIDPVRDLGLGTPATARRAARR